MGLAGLAILGLAATDVNAAVNFNAFSNKLTNPDDVKAGGSKGAVDLHLKNVKDIAEIPKNSLAAYFPNSVTSTKGLKLQIQDGRKGRVCNINAAVATGDIKITISAKNNAKDVAYSVPVKDICSTNKFFGKTIDFPNDDVIEEEGLGRADITVRFTGDAKTSGALGGTDKYSLNYNLQLTGSNSGKTVLALKAGQNIGLRSSFKGKEGSASDRKVEAATVFGYPCNTTPASTVINERAVTLYDVDEGFGSTYFWIEKNGTSLSRGDYNETFSEREGDWVDVSSIVGGSGTTKAWRVEYGDRETVKLVMATSVIDINAKYRVFVLNTGKKHNGDTSNLNPHGNTISVTIPFDSIYGSGKCNYNLDPSVNPPSNSTDTYIQGEPIPVSGHIDVSGSDIDNHDWSLSVRVYNNKPGNRAAAVNGNSPCSWKTGKAGSCDDGLLASGNDKFGSDFTVNKSFDSTTVDVGDWVCFMMSVKKPSYNAPNGRWKHSVMKCVGIQDNLSGTTVDPPTYSYYPSVNIESRIDNLGGYPKIDNFKSQDYKRLYPWRIIEAKFTAMPSSSIGDAQGNACDTIESKYSSTYIAGSCKDDISTGSDLFPDDSASQVKTASSQKDTPDPIGTWTCYTLRYRNNPQPLSSLRTDIDSYVADNNDSNSSSTNSRWTDGYWDHYHSAVTDDDGNVVTPGYYHGHGTTRNADNIWNGYYNETPNPSPASYTYTDYERTSCSVSGIYPKVQVRGGDLRVDGDIVTSKTPIVPPANYRGQYGSFGEYAVLSSGLIQGMGSGAGLNGGQNINDQIIDWNALTFSNNDQNILGNFNGGVTSSFNYTNPIEVEGDLTINNGNAAQFTSGRKIYDVSGTVFITATNLSYADSYQTTEELPRVAIKADNIVVASNVTRIDPWLITGGVLNTCGDSSFNPDEFGGFASADLTINKCGNPLVFNGPVLASQVYLLRTAGSRDAYPEPSAAGRRSLSEPAEIFNLRPDVYLSSFSNNITPNPVAATDRIIDLPPRF